MPILPGFLILIPPVISITKKFAVDQLELSLDIRTDSTPTHFKFLPWKWTPEFLKRVFELAKQGHETVSQAFEDEVESHFKEHNS